MEAIFFKGDVLGYVWHSYEKRYKYSRNAPRCIVFGKILVLMVRVSFYDRKVAGHALHRNINDLLGLKKGLFEKVGNVKDLHRTFQF